MSNMTQIKDNLIEQLNTSLQKLFDLQTQKDFLESSIKEEAQKAKMIRDTLQGISIAEKTINVGSNVPENPGGDTTS